MSLAWLKGHFWLGSFGKLATLSLFVASLGTAGCGDDPVKAGVAKGCTLNSDCDGGLVCSAGLCHQECEETEDCPAGQRCVQTEEANVCQLDNEAECVFNSDCAEPLVCAADFQCRNQCKAKPDCLPGQECVGEPGKQVCAEPTEVDDMGGLKGAVDQGGGGEGGGNAGPMPGAGGEGGSPDVPPPACTPGGECSPAGEPCKTGIITCEGDTEVCTVAGDLEDGTECGADQVCSEGACVSCAVGSDCQPDSNNVCAAGTVSCAMGPACDAAGDAPDGTTCGTDQVCDGGSCVGCVEDAACEPAGQPCKNGALSCSSGPTCVATTNKGAGTECGTDQVCNSAGACMACVQDGPCSPVGAECSVGIMDCQNGPNCSDTGSPAPDGTVCDGPNTYDFCDGGVCAACQNGNPCIPTNPCHKGTLNCGTTPPTCNDTLANADDGVSCGDNKSCISGACVTNDRVLSVTSGQPAAVPVNAPFSTVSVKLVDANNANVQGAAITITASPGAYAVGSATNASGVAQISGRVGRAIGTYTYTVSAPGATNAQFTVDAVAPTDKHIFPLVNVNHLSGAATVPGAGTISKLYGESRAVVSAKDGTLYLASQCAVFKLTPQGHLTRIAGTTNDSYDNCGDSGDSGLGSTLMLYNVRGLALDETNDFLYIADYSNYRVMQLDLASGNMLRFAGDKNATNQNPWGDNSPADGAFLLPLSVQVGPNGDVYIGDGNSNRLRKVDFNSTIITTYLQAPQSCPTAGPLSFSSCGYYYDDGCYLAWDKNGKVFVSAQLCGGGIGSFYGVARIDGPGQLVHLGGNAGAANPAEGGVATSATFSSPPALAFDKAGNLFLAVRDDHRVRRIDAITNKITTVAGNGTAAYAGEYVLGSAAQVNLPTTLSFDDANNLYFGDSGNYAVRGLWNIGALTAPTATLATTAGNNQTVKLDAPFGALTVKLTDGNSANISGVDVRWSRVGTGSGLGANGTATASTKTTAAGNSSMTGRVGLAVDNYQFQASYTDIHGTPVTGSPQTFTVAAEAPTAGTIFPVFNYVHTSNSVFNEGAATYAKMYSGANGVAAASDGTIYASDYASVYAISPRGEVSVLAGTPGSYGFAGDSGPANGAKLNNPHGLALDEARGDSGVLYIADYGNQRIRMVDLGTGVIDTLAGGSSDNTAPYGDGGPGIEANIGSVSNLTVGPDGRVYFPDNNHYRIRVIDPDTTFVSTWLNSTYNVGSCQVGTVSLYYPEWGSAIRFDEDGGAYISGYICWGTTATYVLGIMHRAANGTTTRIVGNTAVNTTENADAVATSLPDLSDFILDSNGDLVLAMWTNHRIRKITTQNGKINTIAGDGTAGYFQPADMSADPGAYVAANTVRLYNPNKLAEYPGGHLLIADRDNYAVRMIW